MKQKVLKKHVNELVSIIKNNGYWSEDVRTYLSNFEYRAAVRLDNKANAIIRMEVMR
ncbi:hypothetical protein [Paraliobacillus ryukyuensis]|uniref:hypothetical protein n=1 Tax=Paraliobacillus ryukyuensis TaxID=200904 RepID=UPI0015C44745|nr:hypothetical protein [Paraliobacillus ryukyuensis]